MAEFIGKIVVLQHVQQAKIEILEKEEKMKGIFHCMIVRSGGGRGWTQHDYLIITDKRVIVWGRGLFSKNVETFNYEKITNVQAHQGLLLGEIEFNVFGTKERFKNMARTDVLIAKKMIEEGISEQQSRSSTVVLSPEERLEKLVQMLEKNMITKKEFEQQKKRILNE